MTKHYMDIIARILARVDAVTDADMWRKSWVDADAEYPNRVKPIGSVESVFNDYYKRERITYIEDEQNKSFYMPDADAIVLPTKAQFESTSAYYAVKAHESIHSTGDYTRCFREGFDEFKSVQFGNLKYSREELTAEIGAIFLLDALGIDAEYAEASAGIYIHHWRSKLNNNNKWIYDAGELAQDAVEYILNI